MSQSSMKEQLENIQSSINKKYEDNASNPVLSALSHLNISEIDLERFKRAVAKTQKKMQRRRALPSSVRSSPIQQQTKMSPKPAHHTHTNPQHRNVPTSNNSNMPDTLTINSPHPDNIASSAAASDDSHHHHHLSLSHLQSNREHRGENTAMHGPILSMLNACDNCEECTEQARWTWLYLLTLVCRYLAYFFILCTLVMAIVAMAAQMSTPDHPIPESSSSSSGAGIAMNRTRAEDLTGMETLKLLTQSVGHRMWSLFRSLHDGPNAVPPNTDDDATADGSGSRTWSDIIDDDLIIQSIDTATVFIKASDHEELHFVPFRKPKQNSECAQKEYSFTVECVNVHNVRDVTFHAKVRELEFLISGSYPRLIEVTEQTTIILNDRVFGISADGESLTELTNDELYENGERFCTDHISFVNDDINRIIISGSCYGLLFLPKSVFWNKNELQLLSSQWSSIILDSKIFVHSLIIAANGEASVILRNKLSANHLNLAITDSAYVEFKSIHDSNYVSLISLKGSQIYISSLQEIIEGDFAARNHSMIEIANILQCNDVHISTSHFGTMRIPNIRETRLTFTRTADTSLLLPAPYGMVENDSNFGDTHEFE
mmetsp:Transcript_32674/g.53003  ORF Transcript_32674/g.53003 Transcript_32674/m.53003 type:complete len:603 (-) Transcript_32674:199-2007(-)